MKKKKLKICYHSSFSKLKSGFGRNTQAVLSYLWKTGKYDLVEYAAGPLTWTDERCKHVPWKCYGALPDNPRDLERVQDGALLRHIHYGAGNIDRVIQLEKPDLYIGAEDIWAFNGYWNKSWWDKFPCVIWTTLDSLPIYPLAIEAAGRCKNFWVWASFAEEALKGQGFDHVKTVSGAVGNEHFYPLPEETRKVFREASGIKEGEKVFGFVFRNQLRKLVGNLLEGLSLRLKEDPSAKVLLHTSWAEPTGWNIPEFIREFNIPEDRVLTTYVCANCRVFTVSEFKGVVAPCLSCSSPNTMITPNPQVGVTEEQMNIIYNIMDAYIHPMTSGGLEMPIIEAMLAGLPVATVPYSCGTEYTKNDFVYSLSYTTNRECSSNFIKANVDPQSIKSFMKKVSQKPEQYKSYGLKGREWARDFFSDERLGKFLEGFIDSLPENSYDYKFTREKRDEKYPLKDISDDAEWIMDMYSGILKMDEGHDSKGVQDWLESLRNGVSRKQIYDFFIETARRENQTDYPKVLADFIEDNGNKKICYTIPESLGDCFISLNVLKSIRDLYPDYDIYVCTKVENFQIFKPLGWVKLIPYSPEFENFQIWEGGGPNKGLVDIWFAPFFATQRFPAYTHNGLDIDVLQKEKGSI